MDRLCGYSIAVIHYLAKVKLRVRLPLPAQHKIGSTEKLSLFYAVEDDRESNGKGA